MSLKPTALVTDDDKTSIKINPHRVNCPGSPNFSSIYFGHEQTMGVAVGLETVEELLSGS